MNTSSVLSFLLVAVLSLFSSRIEAQGRSIDFYLEQKALDRFVDGLEPNDFTRSLRWLCILHVRFYLDLFWLSIVKTLPVTSCLRWVLGTCSFLTCVFHERSYVLVLIVHKKGSNICVSVIQHAKETHSLCFHIPQHVISRAWWAWAECLRSVVHTFSHDQYHQPSDLLKGCLPYQQCGDWGASSAMYVNELSAVEWKAPKNCTASIFSYNLKGRNLLQGCSLFKYSHSSLFLWVVRKLVEGWSLLKACKKSWPTGRLVLFLCFKPLQIFSHYLVTS